MGDDTNSAPKPLPYARRSGGERKPARVRCIGVSIWIGAVAALTMVPATVNSWYWTEDRTLLSPMADIAWSQMSCIGAALAPVGIVLCLLCRRRGPLVLAILDIVIALAWVGGQFRRMCFL